MPYGRYEARYNRRVDEPLTVLTGQTQHCALHPNAQAVGTCARCGDFFCATCTSEGMFCRACGERGARLPWLDRSELGLLKAFFLTIKTCVREPKRFAAALPKSGSLFEASWFGLLCASIGFGIPSGLLGVVLSLFALVTSKGASPAPWWIGLIAAPFYLLGFLGTFVIGAFGFPLVLKLSTRLCSIPMRYGELLRIVMYTSVGSLIAWVPMVGLGAWLLQLVLTCMAVAAHTRATQTRAAVAVLGPIALIVGAMVLLYAGIILFALWGLKSAAS